MEKWFIAEISSKEFHEKMWFLMQWSSFVFSLHSSYHGDGQWHKYELTRTINHKFSTNQNVYSNSFIL